MNRNLIELLPIGPSFHTFNSILLRHLVPDFELMDTIPTIDQEQHWKLTCLRVIFPEHSEDAEFEPELWAGTWFKLKNMLPSLLNQMALEYSLSLPEGADPRKAFLDFADYALQLWLPGYEDEDEDDDSTPLRVNKIDFLHDVINIIMFPPPPSEEREIVLPPDALSAVKSSMLVDFSSSSSPSITGAIAETVALVKSSAWRTSERNKSIQINHPDEPVLCPDKTTYRTVMTHDDLMTPRDAFILERVKSVCEEIDTSELIAVPSPSHWQVTDLAVHLAGSGPPQMPMLNSHRPSLTPELDNYLPASLKAAAASAPEDKRAPVVEAPYYRGQQDDPHLLAKSQEMRVALTSTGRWPLLISMALLMFSSMVSQTCGLVPHLGLDIELILVLLRQAASTLPLLKYGYFFNDDISGHQRVLRTAYENRDQTGPPEGFSSWGDVLDAIVSNLNQGMNKLESSVTIAVGRFSSGLPVKIITVLFGTAEDPSPAVVKVVLHGMSLIRRDFFTSSIVPVVKYAVDIARDPAAWEYFCWQAYASHFAHGGVRGQLEPLARPQVSHLTPPVPLVPSTVTNTYDAVEAGESGLPYANKLQGILIRKVGIKKTYSAAAGYDPIMRLQLRNASTYTNQPARTVALPFTMHMNFDSISNHVLHILIKVLKLKHKYVVPYQRGISVQPELVDYLVAQVRNICLDNGGGGFCAHHSSFQADSFQTAVYATFAPSIQQERQRLRHLTEMEALSTAPITSTALLHARKPAPYVWYPLLGHLYPAPGNNLPPDEPSTNRISKYTFGSCVLLNSFRLGRSGNNSDSDNNSSGGDDGDIDNRGAMGSAVSVIMSRRRKRIMGLLLH
ncbi:hypothetical protein DXG01_015546 [Tephrocybe rancida]|nr:hypothetical protein DXG01_015546 [Tephrocybe rancida]